MRLALTTAPASDPEREHGPWRAAVARALAAALGTPPGPVHLNLPFAEPLVPDAGTAPAGRPGGAPWTAVSRPRVHTDPLALDPAAPTLVVAGAGAPPEVRGWGLPVIAEPASGVWDVGLRSGPWLLGALPDALRPAQVIVAGRPTLHRPVQRLLADPRVAVYALADPQGRSWTDVAGAVRAVGAAPSWKPGPDWTARWLDADRAAGKALDAALDAAARPAVCGWPGRWSTRCPAARCSSWARRTRSATCRSRRHRVGTSRCWPTGASRASTGRCRPPSARPSPTRDRGTRCSVT